MKRGCLIAAGIGVFLSIVLIIFVASRWRDIPPVDDSDLMLPARNVDPAQNPFPEIRSLTMSADAEDSAVRAWEMIRGDGSPDDEFISNLLSIEAETLEKFESFSRMTDWREDQEITVDSELPYLSSWMAIARLKAVETRQALGAKQVDVALRSALSILRFGEGLHHAEGGFIHQMVSAAITNLAIVEILKIVESGHLSSGRLASLGEIISALSFSPGTFSEAYIVEYRTFEKVVDDLATGKVNIGQIHNTEEGPSIPGNPPASFFFKRNKTLKLLGDAYREFIAEAGMIRSEAPGEPFADAKAMRENTGALYFSGNLVGRILFSIIIPSGQRLNDTQAATGAALDLLRIRIAIEQYRIEKGDLPEDLKSLVPEFLDGVPMDPMDGQPMRYSRKKQVIYSVGVDFVDDGGTDPKREGSLNSRNEIAIEIRTDADASAKP